MDGLCLPRSRLRRLGDDAGVCAICQRALPYWPLRRWQCESWAGCGHQFHLRCVVALLKSDAARRCPVCRRDVHGTEWPAVPPTPTPMVQRREQLDRAWETWTAEWRRRRSVVRRLEGRVVRVAYASDPSLRESLRLARRRAYAAHAMRRRAVRQMYAL